MSRQFRPPVRATSDGYVLGIDSDDREVLAGLMAELRTLLEEGEHPGLARLFPVAYPDDDEKEAEYQRLMRDELVASRVAAIETVTELLAQPKKATLDAAQMTALMQSLNAIRVVLGSILGITTDEDASRVDAEDGPESQLYAYLSWLLEWTVQALSSASPTGR